MKKVIVVLILCILAIVQFCNAQPYQIAMDELTIKASNYTEVDIFDGKAFYTVDIDVVNISKNDGKNHTIDIELFYIDNGIVKSTVYKNIEMAIWNDDLLNILIKMPYVEIPRVVELENIYYLKMFPFKLTIN